MGPGPAKDLYWPIKIKAFLNIRPLDFFVIVPLKLICNDVISSRSPTKPNPRWVFKTLSLSANDIYYRILSWLGVERSHLITSLARDPCLKRAGNVTEHLNLDMSLAKAAECRAHIQTQRFIPGKKREISWEIS